MSILVMYYMVKTRQQKYDHHHPTSCFTASAQFYGNYISS